MTLLGEFSGFQAGLAMGAASMISVGPNNLLLLREGLSGGRSGLVASIMCASYAMLIGAALGLAATAGSFDPSVRLALSISGLLALSWFAIQSFRSALSQRVAGTDAAERDSSSRTISRTLQVIWMNPLTYLELLLVPAALAQSFGNAGDRLEFVTALTLMSAVCCFGYAYAGRLIATFLQARDSLRIFDFCSALILTGMSVSMGAGLVATLS